jgi:hypothetical protein
MDKFVTRKRKNSNGDDIDLQPEPEVCGQLEHNEEKKGAWKPAYDRKRKEGPSKDLTAKWLTKYKWLSVKYDTPCSGRTSFFCSWCNKTKRNNIFTAGKQISCVVDLIGI